MIPRFTHNSRPHGQSIALFLGLLAALSTATASAHASIVTDGGFEAAGAGTTYYAGQYIDPSNSWYVKLGAVYIDSADPYVYDGNNSLNLTYDNLYAPNTITQTISTVIGQYYRINFWGDADTANTFSLTENGLVVTGLPTSIVDNGFPSSTNSSLFQDYSGSFFANSAITTLALSSTASPAIFSGDGSVMIDDFSVQTPEPPSAMLLLTGIVGLGLAARKRLTASLRSL